MSRGSLLAPFSRPFPKVDFWMRFGHPVAPFWLPFGALGLHFGAVWLPSGSLLAPLGFTLAPFWLPLAPFGSLLALFNYPSAPFSSIFHYFSPFLFVFMAFCLEFDPKPYFSTHLNSIRASSLLRTLRRSISPTLLPSYLARCGICRRHLDPHRAAGTPVRV